MAEDNSKQEGQEVSVWPGRYWIKVTVKRWPHGGGIYREVDLLPFRPDVSEEEARTLLEPLGYKHDMEDRDYAYAISQAVETFTEEEADRLISWLVERIGVKAWKEPALKPREGFVGVGTIAVGGSDGFYMLDKIEGYDLPFRVWAYYDIDDAEYLMPESSADLEAYLKRKAIDRLKSYIDTDIKDLTLADLQELKEYLDQEIKSREKGHDRE